MYRLDNISIKSASSWYPQIVCWCELKLKKKKIITAGSLSDFLGLSQLFQVITVVKTNFKFLDTRTTLTPGGQQFYHQRSSPSKDSALGSRESTPGGVSITSQPRPCAGGSEKQQWVHRRQPSTSGKFIIYVAIWILFAKYQRVKDFLRKFLV